MIVNLPYKPLPSLSYMICSTARSGSTLLTHTMINTRLAGEPQEYFNPRDMKPIVDHFHPKTMSEYIKILLNIKQGPNGVFGFKIHYPQYRDRLSKRNLHEIFPNLKFVYITRNNKIKQALSFWRASWTEQWVYTPNQKEAPFQYPEIKEYKRNLEMHEEGWQQFFEKYRIQPFTIVYEQYVKELDRTIIELYKYLGIQTPPGFRVPPPPLKKQAGKQTDSKAQMFTIIEQVEQTEELIDEGNLEQAHETILQAKELAPQSPLVINTLGKILFSMNKTEEAKKQFKKALQIKPDYEDANLNLAVTLLQSKKIKEAREISQQILESNPDDPQAQQILDSTS